MWFVTCSACNSCCFFAIHFCCLRWHSLEKSSSQCRKFIINQCRVILVLNKQNKTQKIKGKENLFFYYKHMHTIKHISPTHKTVNTNIRLLNDFLIVEKEIPPYTPSRQLFVSQTNVQINFSILIWINSFGVNVPLLSLL